MELNAGNIPDLVARHAAAHGNEVILRKKDRGIWKATTWSDLRAQVQAISAGLREAGCNAGDAAAVLAYTRPETAQADLAILAIGGISIAIHPDEDAARVGEILQAANCRMIFVENEEQLDKVLTVRARFPLLTRVVIFDMKGLRDFSDPQCSSFADFTAHGRGRAPDTQPITDSQPALVLFPRGESASAGHMLTHGDVMHMIRGGVTSLGLRTGDERLAVLPMSDVTERVLGLYLSLATRTVTNYLESPETAVENLQQLQPTVFGADADAWESLHRRITRAAAGATPLQRALYDWAIRAGRDGGLMRAVASPLVLRAVRRELGLNKLRLAYIGGRAVPAEVVGWAYAMGITLRQLGRADPAGQAGDERYRTLLQDAYAGT